MLLAARDKLGGDELAIALTMRRVSSRESCGNPPA